jgi:hypothetical protein
MSRDGPERPRGRRRAARSPLRRSSGLGVSNGLGVSSGGLVVMMRERPRDTFLGWVTSLGPRMADEMAARCVSFAPAALLGDAPDAIDQGIFRRCIERSARSAPEEVGMILTLAGLVDFAFRGRSSAEEWETLRDLEAQIAARRGDGASTPAARNEALGFPLRAKRWMRAFASWDDLRRTTLSVEALEDYLDEGEPL